MEEKKLTDEEALKAVEICHTFGIHCSTCPAYKYEADNCDNIAGLALVDYCRRLQSENEAWKLRAKELETAWEISSSNEEKLQKQVDELKARDMSEMRDLFKAETDRLIEKANQQTEKDTAKEILEAVDKESNGQTISVTNVLRKRYGVEVE